MVVCPSRLLPHCEQHTVTVEVAGGHQTCVPVVVLVKTPVLDAIMFYPTGMPASMPSGLPVKSFMPLDIISLSTSSKTK